ncbi:hypothetical protein ABZ776_37805, partial [Streptomyces sp. NPDC007076]|uniref:hypothetical protein n=1 Tax=Streptomyces sp. NPDC007076 TaxID=3160975 RepID=UPI0033F469FB
MPAQFEEVIVHADTVQTENLGERHTQDLLLKRRGTAATDTAGTVVRGGKSSTVELAVRGQRQRVEDDDRRGNHVLGQ